MKLTQGAIKLIPRVSFSFRCFYTTLLKYMLIPRANRVIPRLYSTLLVLTSDGCNSNDVLVRLVTLYFRARLILHYKISIMGY